MNSTSHVHVFSGACTCAIDAESEFFTKFLLETLVLLITSESTLVECTLHSPGSLSCHTIIRERTCSMHHSDFLSSRNVLLFLVDENRVARRAQYCRDFGMKILRLLTARNLLRFINYIKFSPPDVRSDS